MYRIGVHRGLSLEGSEEWGSRQRRLVYLGPARRRVSTVADRLRTVTSLQGRGRTLPTLRHLANYHTPDDTLVPPVAHREVGEGSGSGVTDVGAGVPTAGVLVPPRRTRGRRGLRRGATVGLGSLVAQVWKVGNREVGLGVSVVCFPVSTTGSTVSPR